MSTKKLQILDKITKQPDWNQTDEAASDFIKNKPDIDSAIAQVRSEIPEIPVTSVNGMTGDVVVNSVPVCSVSNNGQFLRVVDGVSAWATIPNAEEVGF